jgi:hypothetical protein
VAAKKIRGMDLENLRDHYWNILSLEQSRLGIPEIHGIHGSRCPISERILARKPWKNHGFNQEGKSPNREGDWRFRSISRI